MTTLYNCELIMFQARPRCTLEHVPTATKRYGIAETDDSWNLSLFVSERERNPTTNPTIRCFHPCTQRNRIHAFTGDQTRYYW